MSDAASVALSPETVLAQMKANGVTDIVWLEDQKVRFGPERRARRQHHLSKERPLPAS